MKLPAIVVAVQGQNVGSIGSLPEPEGALSLASCIHWPHGNEVLKEESLEPNRRPRNHPTRARG